MISGELLKIYFDENVDLKTIKDTATWANPTAKPEGINYVIVNGKLVLDEGLHTGATPGSVLYGPGHKAE